jgi:propanediol dehydratase large subunit
MKYLKRYSQINEVNINSDEFRTIAEDIRDILLELEDGGRIKTSIETTSGKFKTYIGFHLSDFYDYDGFYFNEVSEYVFRIKDYLGDNLKSCSVLLVGDKDMMDHTLHRTEIDITKEESASRMLDGLAIENLIIQIK